MKKLLAILLSIAGHYSMAQETQQLANEPRQAIADRGQSIRLHVYTTYAFDDKVDSYYSASDYYEGTIKGGFEWGGGLEYMLNPAYGVELFYLRLDTKAPITYEGSGWTGLQSTEFDLASNYVMLGFNKYLAIHPKVEPYGGMQLGMTIFHIENPDNGNSGNATKFTWGLKAGVNIWATEKIAIKMQAGLLSAVQSVGGGFYFGTGGAGAGVSSYSTFYQWTLGGGLAFNLGGK